MVFFRIISTVLKFGWSSCVDTSQWVIKQCVWLNQVFQKMSFPHSLKKTFVFATETGSQHRVGRHHQAHDPWPCVWGCISTGMLQLKLSDGSNYAQLSFILYYCHLYSTLPLTLHYCHSACSVATQTVLLPLTLLWSRSACSTTTIPALQLKLFYWHLNCSPVIHTAVLLLLLRQCHYACTVKTQAILLTCKPL